MDVDHVFDKSKCGDWLSIPAAWGYECNISSLLSYPHPICYHSNMLFTLIVTGSPHGEIFTQVTSQPTGISVEAIISRFYCHKFLLMFAVTCIHSHSKVHKNRFLSDFSLMKKYNVTTDRCSAVTNTSDHLLFAKLTQISSAELFTCDTYENIGHEKKTKWQSRGEKTPDSARGLIPEGIVPWTISRLK